MASTWSDSRTVSSTVASASETQIGSDINIPQNQTWLINGLFGAHPQGGTFTQQTLLYKDQQLFNCLLLTTQQLAVQLQQ